MYLIIIIDKCPLSFFRIQRVSSGFIPGIFILSNHILAIIFCLFLPHFFIWLLENRKTNKINETDIGIGYNFELKEFAVRLGIERWMYNKEGGKNDFFVTNIDYNKLPVDIGIKISQMLDSEKGTQFTLNGSKNFEIYNYKNINFNIIPKVSTTYLKNFFGTNGNSNIRVNGSINFDNTEINISYKKHNGRK